jgi:adenylate cyclase
MLKDSRKIAAILAADIVGYSRLMGVDEEGTLAALKIRRAIFDRLVSEFEGQEFGSVGDSLMAQFPSALNAVRCAQAIQSAIAAENESLPTERRMTLRIGVNLGDVIEENGLLFGDAVNIAARLQALATPGGVLIAGIVYEQVRNKLSASFTFIGKRQVKNIADPVACYEVTEPVVASFAQRVVAVLKRRVVISAAAYVFLSWLLVSAFERYYGAAGALPWALPALITLLAAGFIPALAVASRFDRRHWLAPRIRITLTSIATVLCCVIVWFAWLGMPQPAAPERSVAVLAFENLSQESSGNVIALGISEAVLHQLASVQQLAVIARTSSFAFQGHNEDVREIGRKLSARYLLEGSVQSDQNQLRVTAQLIDAASGDHLWSMRFDKTRQDIFAVQDEIALAVARALRLSLDASTTDKLTGQRTANLEAYFAYLQGRALASTLRIADLKSAAEQFTRALELDAGFAPAYVELASAKLQVAEFEITDDRRLRFEAALTQASELIAKALELDPANGHAYVERAYISAFSDLAAAEAAYRRGIELSPSYAKAYVGLAAVLYENPAKRDEALLMLDHARRLDPLEPEYDVTKSIFLFYGKGKLAESIELLRGVVARNPHYQPALMRLGESLGCCQGRYAEGIKYLEQAIRLDPLSDLARWSLLKQYIDVGEPETAMRVLEEAEHPLPVRRIGLYLYRHEWRQAGEAAYEAVETGTLAPYDEPTAELAIRLHARVTRDYARAEATLTQLSGVTWDMDGRPIVPRQMGMATATVGLGDILMAGGQPKRARLLLQASITDMDYISQKLGRGDFWYVRERAVALALLGDKEAAFVQLGRAFTVGYGFDDWKSLLETEPAFSGLRNDARFKIMLADARANAAAEHGLLIKMRAQGLVPDRRMVGTP